MPRSTLTADQIVGAAIDLLDHEGLDGLNMRSLGKRLDSAATAIYWHIKTKDDLVRLAGDRIWDEIALPDLATTGWRAAATAMATGLHDMLVRHPWLGQAFGSHLLYGPGKSRYDDHSLALYETAGFSPADADRAAGAVLTYVLGNALGAAAHVSLTRRLAKDGGDPDRVLAETMTRAAEVAAGFPRLRERIGTAAADYLAAPESTFEFGLQALLDGFEARLVRGAAG